MGPCSLCRSWSTYSIFMNHSEEQDSEITRKLLAYAAEMVEAGLVNKANVPYHFGVDSLPVFLAREHVSFRGVDPKLLLAMHTWPGHRMNHFSKRARKKFFQAFSSDEVYRFLHTVYSNVGPYGHGILTDALLDEYRSVRLRLNMPPSLALTMVAGI